MSVKDVQALAVRAYGDGRYQASPGPGAGGRAEDPS